MSTTFNMYPTLTQDMSLALAYEPAALQLLYKEGHDFFPYLWRVKTEMRLTIAPKYATLDVNGIRKSIIFFYGKP